MRRASICLAVLGLIALGLPALSSAAEPTASITKFTAKAIPIPKPGGGNWPKTGNVLGAGSAVEAEYEFTGEGYGATPQNPKGGIPPISQVNFYLPAGAKIHPQGFAKCTEATLKNVGPSGCPKTSIASPLGSVLGEVTFGTERVPEESELRAFVGGAGLLFYTAGHSPVALELVSVGHYVHASAPYGEELITLVPPVATVPGAPLASVKTIHIKAGAAFKKGKKIISYGTLPKKCKGGLPVKTEVIFGGSNQYGNFGIPAKTVPATYKAPCPKKHF
ncbi:MAG: hypothetical protein E6F96_05235 [Actinobacteria bacterium]|nr:MAG: hypothetical protein E6F96_05235 [Actinomycetota bacterium]